MIDRRSAGLSWAILWLMAAFSSAFAQERVQASGGDILITPLAHSSVQVEHGGVVVQVDPWSGADLGRAKSATLVLVTDADDGAHHLDTKALAQVRKAGAPVVVPAAARERVPDGTILQNGQVATVAGVRVEAVGAYDIKPGDPYHPKGEANGYVITLGGKRLYFAGVTECVPEVQALRDIEVAFMPMNLPQGRMAPAAVAECVKSFRPKIVIPYHFDQGYIARKAGRAGAAAPTVSTVTTLAELLSKEGVTVRLLEWYP